MKSIGSLKDIINLQFKPRFSQKKGFKAFDELQPFPFCKDGKKFKGVFTGLSVEILDKNSILSIYKNGFYGKGSHSRGAPVIVYPNCNNKEVIDGSNETLILQLEEAFFLAYFLNVLEIESLNGCNFDWKQFLNEANNINARFVANFAAYLYLKSKSWIVKSGSKFGGDFTVYRNGPELFHASFIAYIVEHNEKEFYIPKNIKCIQRVAETSNKDVLILNIIKQEIFEITSLEDFGKININETIIRRLKLTAFVQCPNVNK